MTPHGWITLALYLGLLVLAGPPLGRFIARILEGRPAPWARLTDPLERLLYRAAGVDPSQETGWKRYAVAALVFNAAGLLVVYALQRLQAVLPLNPQALPGVVPHLAFNTAVSFASNTNWQSYGGETTLSYLVQMLGLTTQNFVSTATGIAVMAALIRGLARRSAETIGNFWADLVRTTLHVLLPLSLVFALALVSQGVVQTFDPYVKAEVVQPATGERGSTAMEQTIAVGPAASQVAIKQLGTNGGGFFNVNSAHPLENPTPLSNLLELLAILLIPVALCFAFGEMVADRRQGWAIFAAMTLLFVLFTVPVMALEHGANPRLAALGADATPGALQPGGNMEGKEARFGPAESGLWAAATTAASNGSVNSMHDSFTPLGGMVPMVLMQLGEVVYGGVGSGLYGMLMFAFTAVFISGLMVGRTPEYLGKKIEAFDVQMAMLAVLVFPLVILVFTGISVVSPFGTWSIWNPGPHGLSEILYAYTSGTANNGSAFAGISANTPWYNVTLATAMLVGRFLIIIPMLALAGNLARKNLVPPSLGTFPVTTPLFATLLVGVIVIVGVLTFFPVLSLGPIVEHFLMRAGTTF